MAGKRPYDAVKAFVAPIQAALGCFLDGKVTADSSEERSPGVLTLNKGEHVRLFGGRQLSLSLDLRYEIVRTADPVRGPWKVNARGYMYDLREGDQSLFEYHWHPLTGQLQPHLHCSKVLKGHIPTGRVLIEDVLCLAYECGAEPRDEAKWLSLDMQNRARFALGATWGIQRPLST